jgi:hypothetical protein
MKKILLSLTLGCAFAAMLAAAQDDPRKSLQQSIEKVRAKSCYTVKFKAVMHAPNSDPLVIEGTSVWVKPNVLWVHYKASGGDEKRIVRVGDKAWVYHELIEDWVTAEEMGNSGAGRGVQCPDDVMSVIHKHAQKVVAGGNEKVGGRNTTVYETSLTGPEIVNVMKEQPLQANFIWKESKVSGRFRVDPADGLIYKFSSTAVLKSGDENLKGNVEYTSDVEVLSYDKDRSLSFSVNDPQTGKATALTVPKYITDAIDKTVPKK